MVYVFFSNCDQERDCLRFVLSAMHLGMLDKQWDGKCRRSALLYYNMNDDEKVLLLRNTHVLYD